jgi:hypothetical protein
MEIINKLRQKFEDLCIANRHRSMDAAYEKKKREYIARGLIEDLEHEVEEIAENQKIVDNIVDLAKRKGSG